MLPVVDLRRFRDPATRGAFVAELGAALAEHGFFYLTGHGIPAQHRHDAMAASTRAVHRKANVGRELDFVSSSARTEGPHGGASYVQMSKRNRTGRH